MDDYFEAELNAEKENTTYANIVTQPPDTFVTPQPVQLPRTTSETSFASALSSLEGGGPRPTGRLKIKVAINGHSFFMLLDEEEKVVGKECRTNLESCQMNALVLLIRG